MLLWVEWICLNRVIVYWLAVVDMIMYSVFRNILDFLILSEQLLVFLDGLRYGQLVCKCVCPICNITGN